MGKFILKRLLFSNLELNEEKGLSKSGKIAAGATGVALGAAGGLGLAHTLGKHAEGLGAKLGDKITWKSVKEKTPGYDSFQELRGPRAEKLGKSVAAGGKKLGNFAKSTAGKATMAGLGAAALGYGMYRAATKKKNDNSLK